MPADGEPIYEFGARQVLGQVGFADLRPIFRGKQYLGADIQPGPGVDVILDLHQIGLPAEAAGTVLLLDTIEHVEFPRKAIEEAHRILKPGGILVISSAMKCRIHGYPRDYWRFTPEGFKSLLKPFAASFVAHAGRSDFPHTVVGVGFKQSPPAKLTDELAGRVGGWQRRWPTRLGRGLMPLKVVYRHITTRLRQRPG